jgi:hypothetical protein
MVYHPQYRAHLVMKTGHNITLCILVFPRRRVEPSNTFN